MTAVRRILLAGPDPTIRRAGKDRPHPRAWKSPRRRSPSVTGRGVRPVI